MISYYHTIEDRPGGCGHLLYMAVSKKSQKVANSSVSTHGSKAVAMKATNVVTKRATMISKPVMKAMKVSKSTEIIDIGKSFIQAMKVMKKNKANPTPMKSMRKKTTKRNEFTLLDWLSGLFHHLTNKEAQDEARYLTSPDAWKKPYKRSQDPSGLLPSIKKKLKELAASKLKINNSPNRPER
jgi:hypothetical protein